MSWCRDPHSLMSTRTSPAGGLSQLAASVSPGPTLTLHSVQQEGSDERSEIVGLPRSKLTVEIAGWTGKVQGLL